MAFTRSRKGMELGKRTGDGLSILALRFSMISNVRLVMDRKNWLYDYGPPPKKERSRAGANKNRILFFIIRFKLLFLSVSFLDVPWASLPSLYHSKWEKGSTCGWLRCYFTYYTSYLEK